MFYLRENCWGKKWTVFLQEMHLSPAWVRTMMVSTVRDAIIIHIPLWKYDMGTIQCILLLVTTIFDRIKVLWHFMVLLWVSCLTVQCFSISQNPETPQTVCLRPFSAHHVVHGPPCTLCQPISSQLSSCNAPVWCIALSLPSPLLFCSGP